MSCRAAPRLPICNDARDNTSANPGQHQRSFTQLELAPARPRWQPCRQRPGHRSVNSMYAKTLSQSKSCNCGIDRRRKPLAGACGVIRTHPHEECPAFRWSSRQLSDRHMRVQRIIFEDHCDAAVSGSTSLTRRSPITTLPSLISSRPAKCASWSACRRPIPFVRRRIRSEQSRCAQQGAPEQINLQHYSLLGFAARGVHAPDLTGNTLKLPPGAAEPGGSGAILVLRR